MLSRYTNHCNITNGLGHCQITCESDDTFWVGYHHYHGLTVHPYCPFAWLYTVPMMKWSFLSTIQTFNVHRTGQASCVELARIIVWCWALLIANSAQTSICCCMLILFTLIGVALVFLLLVCKLTVATGTPSDLVFYANIVGANHNIVLPVKSADVLSIFIAWLNLDFGIETCFFWWNRFLQQNMAAVFVPNLYLDVSRTHNSHLSFLTKVC